MNGFRARKCWGLFASVTDQENHAKHAIVRNAAGGEVAALCKRFINRSEDDPDEAVPTSSALLAPAFWAPISATTPPPDVDWRLDDFVSRGYEGHYRVVRTALGVTFREDQVRALISVATYVPPVVLDQGESRPRGRPEHKLKEPLLVEIAAQFAANELSASNQASIEKAILQWVEDQGKSIAESTARVWAKPIWAAIQRKADK